MIILRESHIDIQLFAGFCAYQLIFKARNEASASYSQFIVLSFSALERYAIYTAVKVQFDDIAIFNASVIYIDGSGVLFSSLCPVLPELLRQ